MNCKNAVRLTLAFLLTFAFVPDDSHAQERNVTFVHGLFGGSNSLTRIQNDVDQDFQIDPRRIGYSSDNSIPSIASLKHSSIQSNSVVVAHSMGGLVSRSMVDQFGTSRVDALITTGTPHDGVLAATTVRNGVAAELLQHWVNDLSLGFVALGGFSQGDAVAQVILDDVFEYVDFRLEQKFDVESVKNMQLGSNFLSGLNGNFSGSTPSSTYSIGGLEDWNAHYRLASASLTSDDKEGNVIDIVNGAKYSYLATSFAFGFIASYNLYLYNQTGDWIYYDRYVYFTNVAQSFFVGFDSLNRQQQLEWDLNITGAWGGPGTPHYFSDGLVPYTSQVPSDLRGGRELRAYSANHIELTARENALDRVQDAFRKRDVNVPRANQAPSASFTSSVNGNSASFTNQSSDPDGSVSGYQWSFGDGSTSSSVNPTHYYSSSGTYYVTLTVTDDDGASSTTSRSVYIAPDTGDCISPPCPILETIEDPNF